MRGWLGGFVRAGVRECVSENHNARRKEKSGEVCPAFLHLSDKSIMPS